MIPGVQSQDQKDKQIRMLGLRIDNLTMSEALDWIMNRIQSRAHGAQISFINAHCANVARKHSKYRGILASSDLVLADGIGMKVAGDLLEKPIVENVNGTDMFPLLCSQLDKCSGRVYLLGGGPGVADKVASWISSHYPDIRIVGARSGFFSERQNQLEVAAIKRARPDVLLVAMGVPRQELWITKNLEASGARIGIGVGGLFDFYSGRIPRAPKWLRKAGLEWMYRLYQEPGRMWQRYMIGNFSFAYRVMLERFELRASLQRIP